MNESERDQLAKQLSAMTWKQARKAIYDLDRAADLKFYRNSTWDEYHTLFTLPNAELAITLVEKGTFEPSSKTDFTGPRGSKLNKAEFQYVEARVAALDRPAHKNGGQARYQFK